MKTIPVYLVFLIVGCMAQMRPAVAEEQSAQQWLEDIAYLTEQLPLRHRNLFHTMSREQFEKAVADLKANVATMSREQIVMALARIGAMIGDGHSGIRLIEDPQIGFRSFPLLLRLFEDGLFVASVDRDYAHLAGARIIKIGDQDWEKVWQQVETLVSADNEMMKKAFTPPLMTKAEILRALGVIQDPQTLPLVVEQNGKQQRVEVRLILNGQLQYARFVSARSSTTVPLSLKHPSDFFWFEYLPESKTVYVQFNKVADKKDESVAQFFARVFDFVEKNAVDRFVLDLRWNTGGVTVLNRPLVTGIIRSNKINQRGKLFTLIGRNTFSAAIHCVNELEKYTQTIFVGEPTGGAPNHFGVPVGIELPNSGLLFFASTLWRQDADPADRRRWIAPDVAAPMYFKHHDNGIDPALEAVSSYVVEEDIAEKTLRLVAAGKTHEAKAALQEFRRNPLHQYVDTERKTDWVGFMLLSWGRTDEAIEVFGWNVQLYPDSWHAHESLAEAYSRAGKPALAVQSYTKAVQFNPNANVSLAGLRRLQREAGYGYRVAAGKKNRNRQKETSSFLDISGN